MGIGACLPGTQTGSPPVEGAHPAGVLPLSLPAGATLLQLAVIGEFPIPRLMQTSLVQEQSTAPFTAVELVKVAGVGHSDIPGRPVVDPGSLYYLTARLDPRFGVPKLRGFSLTYQA